MKMPIYSSTSVRSQRGFSLLEVLIALLVLSLGLLGLAGLQTFSLRFNHQSYERTQATMLIYDMADRMRTNLAALSSYNSVNKTTPASSYGYGSCPSSCSDTQLANYNIAQWKSRIAEPGMLAGGQGGITVVTPGVYDISVHWIENDISMTQTMRVQLL